MVKKNIVFKTPKKALGIPTRLETMLHKLIYKMHCDQSFTASKMVAPTAFTFYKNGFGLVGLY